MKFCQPHWDALQQRIDDRGLMHLTAKDGEVATQQMQQQVLEQRVTKETFDPLMAAHWAIVNNAMETLSRVGINPLYLMGQPDAEAIAQGRNDCPLCELNFLHKQNCKEPGCQLDKEKGYDWMLDRAADDALQTARELGMVGRPS